MAVMDDPSPEFQAEALRAEYAAACTRLERAESSIMALTETGFPIEYMDLEFLEHSRAHSSFNRIQQKLGQRNDLAE